MNEKKKLQLNKLTISSFCTTAQRSVYGGDETNTDTGSATVAYDICRSKKVTECDVDEPTKASADGCDTRTGG